jgi:hypothetical protein
LDGRLREGDELMFGLNPFAQIDPFELEQMKKSRGLLGQAFEPPPMVQQPQPGMAINPVGRPIPGQPQDYNDARNDTGNFQAQVSPARQMLPPLDIGQPQPPQPSAPPPRMVGAPPPQGPEPDIPLPPQRPPEFSAPTPDQRQLQATTAGTPQDQQPQSGPFGMDLSKLGEGLSGGLDRMTSDPLFNLGIGILSNPRNIGQGLAAGLQSARAAKDSESRKKLYEQAANRKNIHWFTRPDGTLAGVKADNPSELVVPPGQTPKAPRGIIQAGEQGVPQGYFGISDQAGGVASIHPIAQQESYSEVRDEQGNVIGQKSSKTGKVENYPRQGEIEKFNERSAIADKLGLQGDARTNFITSGKQAGAAGGSEKITGEQANAANFASRMQAADQILNNPDIAKESQGGHGVMQKIYGAAPFGVGNFMQTPNYQRLDQAQRDFINATLRRESGAAINEKEFDNARKQYFPQPGDSAEVIAQKAANRQTAMEGVAFGAPGSFKKQFFGTETPDISQRALERARQPGATGSVETAPPMQGARQAPDGNWYVQQNGKWHRIEQ